MPIRFSAPMSAILKNTTINYVRILTLFYFVVKGLVVSILTCGSFPYLFYYLDTSGYEYQLYSTLPLLPWSCKAVVGILTDLYPIGGYHKKWYAIAAAFTLPFWLMGMVLSSTPTVYSGMGTLASTSIMILDALMEGELMYNVRFRRADKGTLSYTLQCTMFGSIFGPIVIGMSASNIQNVGNIRYAFIATVFMVLPFSIILLRNTNAVFAGDTVSTSLNERMIQTESSKTTIMPYNKKETIFGVYLTLMSIVTYLVLLFEVIPVVSFVYILCVIVTTCVMITITYDNVEYLRHLCLIGFLVGVVRLDISGIFDTYFTAQNDNCIIDGPKFDFMFYITATAVLGGLVGAAISYLYRVNFIKNFDVRSTVLVSTLLYGCASIGDIIIIKRWNITVLHMSDKATFLLWEALFSEGLAMGISIPLMTLTSLAVKRGAATLTAMNVISCMNAGGIVSRVLGMYAMEQFNVHSTENYGCNFDHLVELVEFARLIVPLFGIPLYYLFLPNAIIDQKSN